MHEIKVKLGMKILSIKQNVGQGLKVISQDRILKRKEAKIQFFFWRYKSW